MTWQHRLDDINKDDRITVDIGQTLITGFYKGIQRRSSQDGSVKMFVVVAEKQNGKMQQKWVWTKEIENLTVVRRAGT